MHYTPITPFRRPAAFALTVATPAPPCAPEAVDKWQALRVLAVARVSFGLSDRDLSVLETLLGFYPDKVLRAGDTLIVHPSNATICERLNGMPASTMRRHLARLVAAGVVIRRDSPNGKRFARMGEAGKTIYGIDLSPLLTRHTVFAAEAARLTAESTAARALRESLSLMRRDLAHLADFAAARHDGDWDVYRLAAQEAAKTLRRVLSADALMALHDSLAAQLADLRLRLDSAEHAATEKTDSSGAQNERHLQNSNINPLDIEQAPLPDSAVTVAKDAGLGSSVVASEAQANDSPAKLLPLRMVLMACREIQSLNAAPIRTWADLVHAAEKMRPMMGIGTDLWQQVRQIFGAERAAVVLAAILERFDAIRSSGAYLRHLARKMAEGRFSETPMVMALLKQAA